MCCFNDWNKCVVILFMLECCWNEFLVLHIYNMMTIGIEILIGIWLCVFEIMICEYSLMNEMSIWDE
jgi:hypothetical protein